MSERLAEQDTVHVAVSSDRTVLHLDENCDHLDSATGVASKSPAVYPDDQPVCATCGPGATSTADGAECEAYRCRTRTGGAQSRYCDAHKLLEGCETAEGHADD